MRFYRSQNWRGPGIMVAEAPLFRLYEFFNSRGDIRKVLVKRYMGLG